MGRGGVFTSHSDLNMPPLSLRFRGSGMWELAFRDSWLHLADSFVVYAFTAGWVRKSSSGGKNKQRKGLWVC